MSKRGLFITLGYVCVGVAFLLASGADTPGLSYATQKCVGLASVVHWFDEDCSPALVPRLFFMALGVVPAIILFYFADKEDREAKASAASGRPSQLDQAIANHGTTGSQAATGFGRHIVRRDPRDDLYWCAGCGFWSFEMSQAKVHSGPRAGTTTGLRPKVHSGPRAGTTTGLRPTPQDDSLGFNTTTKALVPAQSDPGLPETPQEPVQSLPEHKLCPDCAEEVRAAARKCRFCGYIFETSDASA